MIPNAFHVVIVTLFSLLPTCKCHARVRETRHFHSSSIEDTVISPAWPGKVGIFKAPGNFWESTKLRKQTSNTRHKLPHDQPDEPTLKESYILSKIHKLYCRNTTSRKDSKVKPQTKLFTVYYQHIRKNAE